MHCSFNVELEIVINGLVFVVKFQCLCGFELYQMLQVEYILPDGLVFLFNNPL